MALLRRLAAVFAVALAVLVTVQTLDLVACADETEQAGHTDHGEGTTLADCLCHVTFTPTDALPVVAAAPATPPPPFAPYAPSLESADGRPVEHVPLA